MGNFNVVFDGDLNCGDGDFRVGINGGDAYFNVIFNCGDGDLNEAFKERDVYFNNIFNCGWTFQSGYQWT